MSKLTKDEKQFVNFFTAPQGFAEASSPPAWYKEMWTHQPISFNPENGSWDVFSYKDIKTVLSDHATFSSNVVPSRTESSIISMDPPKHMKYRSLVSKAFTQKSLDDFTPRIHDIARELLQASEDRSEMDVIADLSFPLPVIVIAELLGVRKEEREQFKHWSDQIMRGLDRDAGETPEQYHAHKQRYRKEMENYFVEIIEEKRKQPSNDLISALIAAKVEEQSLNLTELLQFCMLLLIAGNETTTNLIGNAVVCLAGHQEAQREIRTDLSLLPKAIEEVLRYESPVQSLIRRCVKDTELNGHIIRADQTVVLWIGSGNHDSAIFEEPDVFNIRRSPNPHLSFGHGPHFCLGAPLARLEAVIALTWLFERRPPFIGTPGIRFTPEKNPVIYGYKKVPIAFLES